MDNFQSIAALMIVIFTFFTMLYFKVRKRGSSCGGGCGCSKLEKTSTISKTRP